MNMLKTKYSLEEILTVSIPTILILALLYTFYFLNNQLNNLDKSFRSLQSVVNRLELENVFLKELVTQQNLDLQKSVEENINSERPFQNSEMLLANNEMTQFYIKTGGVIVLGLLGCCLLYHFIPSTFFSLKKIIPTGLYGYIQDKTPFLQTKIYYTHQDPASETDWLVEILNERHLNIRVKPFLGNDYVGLSEFVVKLQSDAGTLVTSESATEIAASMATMGSHSASVTADLAYTLAGVL